MSLHSRRQSASVSLQDVCARYARLADRFFKGNSSISQLFSSSQYLYFFLVKPSISLGVCGIGILVVHTAIHERDM